MEKEICAENSSNRPQVNTNTNNNIEQGQCEATKTADQQVSEHVSNESTSTVAPRQSTTALNEIDDMKRAHAKQLIERYFYQLSTGCGSPQCANKNCASSGQFEALTPNQAAARAIQLFSEDAKLCDFPANKTARISNETDSPTQSTVTKSDSIENSTFDDIYR